MKVDEEREFRDVYFGQQRPDIIKLIPEGVERVLDVGCGYGLLGKELKKRGVKEVFGIEIDSKAAEVAQEHLDKVFLGDIEEIKLPLKEGYFDCIIYADILEHLKNPWDVLKDQNRYLKEGGHIVCSIPNIRHINVICSLLMGRFSYINVGILDKTHLRFFTRREIILMIENAGFRVLDMSAKCGPGYLIHSMNDPEVIGLCNNLLKKILGGTPFYRTISEEELVEFFVIQFLVLARKI